MSSLNLNVIALGNAIVDVICKVDEDFLIKNHLPKGSMSIIDLEKAESLTQSLINNVERSGGSAANTAVGISTLGGRVAFVGRVKNDRLGKIFKKDLHDNGVEFTTPITIDGPQTACSIVLVTPDAERTMNTYLGACIDLGPEDIDPNQINAAEIVYLEGYLWDKESAKNAFRKAAKIAKESGRKIAFTLSDIFCVERWRDEFTQLLIDHVDIVFANEGEILSLFKTNDLNYALSTIRNFCDISVITRSEKGSLVITKTNTHEIAAKSVDHVIDTTGAGDLYAAGFLYGLSNNYDLTICGKFGSICSAEIITHLGARPETSLKELIKKKSY